MNFLSGFTFTLGILLFYATAAQATYIDSNGREWRDLTETTGVSYNQIDAQCDVVSNLCHGSVASANLANIDLAGWTWATIDETQRVISEVTGLLVDEVNRFHQESGSLWGPMAISLFGNTEASDGEDNPWFDSVTGMTRTTSTYYSEEDGYPDVYLQVKNNRYSRTWRRSPLCTGS